MKSNKIIERNPSATAAGAEGDVVRDHDSLSEGELESIVGGEEWYKYWWNFNGPWKEPAR